MSKVLKLTGIVVVLLAVIFAALQVDNFAVDKTARYRPLANGWVSGHADMHLQNDVSFFEKVKATIESDLTHGRFRPAFFFYVTSSYALSPIIHQRSVSLEGRPYNELINGDLRLFSGILLASVTLSFVFLSLLIYTYTKGVVFSFIPICFIPLSPSLTSNLLQNYIDSQEIPLVLWLSIWIFSFFMAQAAEGRIIRKLWVTISLLFLILAFLTKETTLVVCVALALIAGFLFLMRDLKSRLWAKNDLSVTLVSLGVAIVFSVMVYSIVTMSKQGYATNYAIMTMADFEKTISTLWKAFSKHTLNNLYGYIPIILFVLLSLKERKKKLNKLPMKQHLALLLLLLLLSYGFLFILIPWKPVLIKYTYPSVFFFSFAVALSLSQLTRWAKERFGAKGLLCYIAILPYVFLYFSYTDKAEFERKYWVETANYGVSIVDQLANSIANEVNVNPHEKQNIYVEYGANVAWENAIPWAELHLLRILNLDKGFNVIDRSGGAILNYRMPHAELSSFRKIDGNKTVFLSNRAKDLYGRKFDVLYVGYKNNEEPNRIISIPELAVCYLLTREQIDYRSTVNFPEFSLYKYLPGACPN